MRRRECLAALASHHPEVAGTRYRVARDLVGLPALGIEASADTLRALAASPRVERVTEDERRRPQR